MSDAQNHDNNPTGNKPVLKKEMSRRQFLTYTLGGTGAFLVATPIIPMIRFSVDPLLQSKGEGEWVKVVELSRITDEPQEFTFSKLQVDGWYSAEAKFTAWITKDKDGNIYALSPICKHLGCTVNWNTSSDYPNQYYCPCHGAHYTKEGKQLAVADAPLDEYDVKIENDFVYLSSLKPNSIV
jgi:menaquinol-cytochrome c reductase iron-sulfur subunit